MAEFVIAYKKSTTDGSLGGFACKYPIEGWTFTALLSDAFKFPSRDEAELVRKTTWPYRNHPDYVVKEVGKGEPRWWMRIVRSILSAIGW